MQALEAHQTEFRSAVLRFDKAFLAMDAKLDRFGEKLDRLSLDVAELKGRVSQLPTTIVLIGFTLAIMAGAGILKYYVR